MTPRFTSIGVAGLGLILVSLTATTASSNDGPIRPEPIHPYIFPVTSRPYGLSYGEWSARWWQWALSLPVSENPFFDGGDLDDNADGCDRGANGQEGPVWFLTGVISTSGTATRTCFVPYGKALFFPIANVECSTVEAEPFFGSNGPDLRECAADFQDLCGPMSCQIDGKVIQNLHGYRVQSPTFEFTLPEDNVLGVDATAGQAVADGEYLMVWPLPVGPHTIHFSASFGDPAFFTLDITYYLFVRDPRIQIEPAE